MDRQPTGVSEPEPPAGLLADGDVAVASLGEVKAGDKGVEADSLCLVVESVQEVVSLGLEPARGELVDSLAGPS